MTLNIWIDIALGLSTIYLGASLFVTIINEYVAQALDLRGRQLREAITRLIDDPGIKEAFALNPALQPYFDTSFSAGKLPSYIDPQALARLLLGVLYAGKTGGDALQRVTEAIEGLPDSSIKKQLHGLIATAGGSMDELLKATSDWADKSLTVLGEAYKRHLRAISLLVGLAVAGLLNIDTAVLVSHLYQHKESRDALSAVSVQITEKTDKVAFDACLKMKTDEREKDPRCAELINLVEIVKNRKPLPEGIPIGWGDAPVTWKAIASHLPGWLLTALALSLGAPFWFDLLNKVVNVRHGIANPGTKKDVDKPVS